MVQIKDLFNNSLYNYNYKHRAWAGN